jgi:hypothetical protein
MNSDKQNMKLVAVTSYKTKEGEKKNRWTTIGIAYANKDGSFNLRFDFLPARMDDQTTIQMRPFDPKRDEQASE